MGIVTLYSSDRMHRILPRLPGRARCLMATVLTLGLTGCGEPPQVTSYKVPKEPPKPSIDLSGIGINQPRPTAPPVAAKETVDPTTGPDRMLGAVVERPSHLWFFKITGPEVPVNAARQGFIDFLKTVEFSGEQDAPRWKLPEGWSVGPERQMRFATLEFQSDDVKLELAISSLPFPGGDKDTFLLMNYNRWLGQMSLPESTLAELSSKQGYLEQIELPGGNRATVVNFRGKLSAGGMAPFAR